MSSWADELLKCAPLRDAVYRNRTPDRGLRHAVSLGCLPFRSFAAVAPWLPPWDIVPPAEACAKVTSLHLTIQTRSTCRRLAAKLAHVADVLSAAGDDKGPTPFGKVRSLNLHFTGLASFDVDHFAVFYALQRIFQGLPALESFVVDRLFHNGLAQQVWLSGDSDLLLLADAQGTPAFGSTAVEAFRKMPRLRTVDIRRVDMYHAIDLFFTSLLLCRGSLRTLSCGSFYAVAALVRTDKRSDTFLSLRIRHSSETPSCPEPESIRLTANQRVPASVVPRVPVHWTLETLVVDPCAQPPVSPTAHLDVSAPEVSFGGQSNHIHAMRYSSWAAAVLLESTDASVKIITAGDSVSEDSPITTSDIRFFERHGHPSVKQEQLDAMHVAHRYVKAVVAAYAADRSLLPETLSRHRAGLDAVVDGGAYPAALLWAFARGPEHTTLRSLCLRDVTVSGEDAASAAVVAFAAWQRKRH